MRYELHKIDGKGISNSSMYFIKEQGNKAHKVMIPLS